MKKLISCLVLTSLLLQIGCSSITQIPYPADQRKSDDEIRQLNYFGERLSSTIHLTNSAGIEAYWLKMKDDRIYFLTEGLNDTTSVNIEKVKSVKFYDLWRGFLFGTLDGLFLGGYFGMAGPNYVMPIIGFCLGLGYGLYALGDREFIYVHNDVLGKRK